MRHKGELAYPNLWLSAACDHVAAFVLRPRGPECTDITCHFLFGDPRDRQARLRSRRTPSDFWDLVNRQELGDLRRRAERACPLPRSFHHGFFAPMEDWNLDIRRYVTDRIAAFVGEHVSRAA